MGEKYGYMICGGIVCVGHIVLQGFAVDSQMKMALGDLPMYTTPSLRPNIPK